MSVFLAEADPVQFLGVVVAMIALPAAAALVVEAPPPPAVDLDADVLTASVGNGVRHFENAEVDHARRDERNRSSRLSFVAVDEQSIVCAE
ncbi:hypothetical protein BASA61_002107 [Batrachochytrium salamandrivorans]|nr:hypothetical protein BASA61_002107 [Batrachochytrium salamandrivorans]